MSGIVNEPLSDELAAVPHIPPPPPDPSCIECGHDLAMWHGSGGCFHGWDKKATECYCEVTS